jgi:hypothetical protein
MYRPSNKVINNLYTQGEFSDTWRYVNGGGLYVGYYHKLPNGLAFTGKNPSSPNKSAIKKDNSPSTPSAYQFGPLNEESATPPRVLYSIESNDTANYSKLIGVTPRPKDIPLPYSSFPSSDDINLGVYDRYFSYQINTKSIIEIDKKTYNGLASISNSTDGPSDKYVYEMYNAFIISWTITGEEDTVFQTNLNAVKIAQQRNKIPNNLLVRFFANDYTQYYTKTTSDLYTSGGEFIVRSTGEEYVGFYHIHPDKGPMVGANHVSYPHDFLDPINGIPDQTEPIITPPTSQTPIYTSPSSPAPPPTTGGGFSGGGGY